MKKESTQMLRTESRIIEITPGWDKRNSDPGKNYGIHNAQIVMVLKKELGAVQFMLGTARYPKHVTLETLLKTSPDLTARSRKTIIDWSDDFKTDNPIQEVIEYQKFLNEIEIEKSFLYSPRGWDLGYHSPKPMYEGQDCMRSAYTKFKIEDDGTLTAPVYGDPLICPWLDNEVPCYYDGSTLNADPLYYKLISEGEESVWNELESYYNSTFVSDE